MLQVRVLHMPDLFKLPHRYRKNALQPGQHVRAPCPGWARRPADKPTQQCAYAKICPDVSDDSHKTCGVWSCAQMRMFAIILTAFACEPAYKSQECFRFVSCICQTFSNYHIDIAKMLCNLASMCGPHAQDGPDDPPTNQRNNARTQKYAPMCQMIHTKPVEFGPAHRCGKNALEPY